MNQRALATQELDVHTVHHVTLAGWAGRSAAAVEAHIHELEALGMPRPSRTPIFYRVAPSLLTTSDTIQVVGTETSGEVEFVLAMRDDGLWVGLGSDHTDRDMERTSVAKSKQLCAKVVAPDLWRFADVAPHWDHLVLRSWAHRGGTRHPYQEATLAALLTPDRLVHMYCGASAPLPHGTALFGGTIATVDAIAPAEEFEMELDDPILGRTLRHRYRIVTLPVES
jgi:hypothetical protein